MGAKRGRSPIQRVLERIEIDANGCWVWPGSRTWGYGQLRVNRGVGVSSPVATHRIAYEALVGPIPDGLHIDHICRNRACCNPDHLEPVTPAENARRGLTGTHNGVKTHCKQGHPFDEDNTRWIAERQRQCKTCHRKVSYEYYLRTRAAS